MEGLETFMEGTYETIGENEINIKKNISVLSNDVKTLNEGQCADIIMILLPDEVQAKVYNSSY